MFDNSRYTLKKFYVMTKIHVRKCCGVFLSKFYGVTFRNFHYIDIFNVIGKISTPKSFGNIVKEKKTLKNRKIKVCDLFREKTLENSYIFF